MSDKKYEKVLVKMFLMEQLGQIVYDSLAAKAVKQDDKEIYNRLSLNEQETENLIINELKKLDISKPIIRKVALVIIAVVICFMLSHNAILKLLTNTLRKRKFKLWFDSYHEYNLEFWTAMLDHEELQFRLLKF